MNVVRALPLLALSATSVILFACDGAPGAAPADAGSSDATLDSAAADAGSLKGFLEGIHEINYYPRDNSWGRMWSSWDAVAIDNDMAIIQSIHATTVRIIIQASTVGFPQPQPQMLQHLQEFVTIAASHGLTSHLTLFDWWSSYGDIPGSKQWANAILAPYANDSRIAFVELQNEIGENCNCEATQVMAWANAMIPYLRSLLPSTPLTFSTYGMTQTTARYSALQAPLDFWDYHSYKPAWATLSELSQVQTLLGNTPIFIGETGAPTQASTRLPTDGTREADGGDVPAIPLTQHALEAYQDYYVRYLITNARRLGLPIPSVWILYDFPAGSLGTPLTDDTYSYGIFRVDGTPKLAAASLSSAFEGKAVDTSFNGGFESGDSFPDSWFMWHGAEAQFARDTTVAHSGVASARIAQSTGDSLGVPEFWTYPFDSDVQPGRAYTLRAWARGAAATGNNFVVLAWFDESGSWLGNSPSAKLPAGDSSWTPLSVTASAPASAARVQIALCSSQNTGAVWFDDVQFGAAM